MKTGYTIKELMDMDYTEIKQIAIQSDAEARKIARTLADAASKRYKRAIDANELDPAITAFRDKYGGKISTKGKSGSELQKEIAKGYYFMQSKTSSSTGRKQVLQAVQDATGEQLSREQVGELWSVIDRLGELYEMGNLPVFGSLGSNVLRNYVANQISSGKTADDILKTANDNLQKLYERTTGDEDI